MRLAVVPGKYFDLLDDAIPKRMREVKASRLSSQSSRVDGSPSDPSLLGRYSLFTFSARSSFQQYLSTAALARSKHGQTQKAETGQKI